MVSSSLVDGFQKLATDERSQAERDFDVGSLFIAIAPKFVSESGQIRARLSRYRASESSGSNKTTLEANRLPHHLEVLNSKIADPEK